MQVCLYALKPFIISVPFWAKQPGLSPYAVSDLEKWYITDSRPDPSIPHRAIMAGSHKKKKIGVDVAIPQQFESFNKELRENAEKACKRMIESRPRPRPRPSRPQEKKLLVKEGGKLFESKDLQNTKDWTPEGNLMSGEEAKPF
ncbi:hypothetical protein FRC02_010256 [Tulasnella sp. 418]|nr:hypothetical protein FRC02_010256 [Tulasnella sp. 418]